ncbi:MarR family transcriptional regulator [Pseudonocardia sp. DSM 110487]|uniref:MarR family winged helix-turn-helix transcriptional regulator n=1 Tax=Pseudonocardia sp. DSM 110487 TaxID=2865833 RepID=UPI001C69918F|nr:helix-turn-helix domain-containing protein [Pseudonocardia sp. DSM 110487]QYN39295.1 MarR family transcriptional regulator [Pseudonocardia sp. DSM 110487]
MTDVDVQLDHLAEASHTLSRTLRRTGELEVGLEQLPASELDVLRFVVTHSGASVSEVARGLRLQTSNVSTTVRALVERGLLLRQSDPLDQRRSLLRASPLADEHRRLLGRAWSRSLASALAELAADDEAAIRAAVPALTRLAESLRRRAEG